MPVTLSVDTATLESAAAATHALAAALDAAFAGARDVLLERRLGLADCSDQVAFCDAASEIARCSDLCVAVTVDRLQSCADALVRATRAYEESDERLLALVADGPRPSGAG